MAISACPICQNQSFELEEAEVKGARYRLSFVQCARCGAPAGVVESRTAALLQEQDLRLKDLQRQVATLEGSLSHVRHIVGSLASQRAL